MLGSNKLKIQKLLKWKLLEVLCKNSSYQIYKPSYSSIYEYSYLISAGFFGWLFWNQIPSLMSLIGILAIIFAGINIAINSNHNDENEKI